MNTQGNMPSGPVGATLEGLTPQTAEIQEVIAMLVILVAQLVSRRS